MAEVTIQVREPYLELIAEEGTLTESRDSEHVEIHVSESTVTIFEGISGPQGAAGESDKHFVFTQSVPSTLWEVTHNLNKKPSVSVVDSADNIVIGDVTYLNPDELTIEFEAGFSGKAYLN